MFNGELRISHPVHLLFILVMTIVIKEDLIVFRALFSVCFYYVCIVTNYVLLMNDFYIGVDETSCIRCGKCVRVCPSQIFVQESKGSIVHTEHIDNCIGCGHCAAVCPTGSVRHSDFPKERVHAIDYDHLPSPEQVMLLCKARRSNRALSSKPVPKKKLETIIEAAHRAPTATNSQSVSFTTVTSPEELQWIGDFTIGIFDGLLKMLNNRIVRPILKPFLPDVYKYVPFFLHLKEEHKAGKDPILRKATAVVIIHTPKDDRFGCENANLAYENGSLMAESLGISQVYMGFVLTAIRQDKKRLFEKHFGITGKVEAIMALGVPSFRYPNYIDRKGAEIKWF